MTDFEFHNKIADICIKHFNKLPKSGKPNPTEWTILSCIVKEENDKFEVVALGTGTKCIGKSKMCPNGTILNDSHAEVICKRSFLRYLYDQMSCEESIYNLCAESEKLVLKSEIKFHFFTSHTPCGDAAIFPKQNDEEFGNVLNTNNVENLCNLSDNLSNEKGEDNSAETAVKIINKEQNRGKNINNVDEDIISTKCSASDNLSKATTKDNGAITTVKEEHGGTKNINTSDEDVIPTKKLKLDEDIYRTGAKCLPNDVKQDPKKSGTGYHVLGVVRTKPGRGDPTESVSCSDKIAKWCHLGIQGALLTLLLEKPIYLSTFTLAGKMPFNLEALERAFYGRLKGAVLQNPYGIVRMEIGQAESAFAFSKYEGKKPCASSIAWIKTFKDRFLEISVDGRKQGVTKKNIHKESSVLKITKLELFKSFSLYAVKFKLKLLNKTTCNLQYAAAKGLAKEYYENWTILKKHFGTWSCKNPNFYNFVVNL